MPGQNPTETGSTPAPASVSPPPSSTSSVQHTSSSSEHTSSIVETSKTALHTTTSTSSIHKSTTSSEERATSTHTTSQATSSTHTETSAHTTTTTSSTSSTESRPTTQATSTSTTSTISSTTTTSSVLGFTTPTGTGTGFVLPTTQSVSGSGDLTFTSYYASTDSNGISHTITQIVAQPSKSVTPGGFIHNSGAVAGVSVVVGIIGAAMLVFGFIYFRKRRQAHKVRDDELADFSQMSYAAGGGGGDYYANAGNYGQQEEQAHHIPMRSPSAGSLNRAPMAPLDSYRGGSIIGHPYASRPTRSHEGNIMDDEFVARGDSGAMNGSYDPYSSYAHDVVGQTPNHAGYGAGRTAAPTQYPPYNERAYGHQQGYDQHLDGLGAAMVLEDDPFAHSEDGHGQAASSASYYGTSLGQPGSVPRRSMSTKSRGMTFGHPEQDDEYFDNHGPTNDDDSIVLGRPSATFGSDGRVDDGTLKSQRSGGGRTRHV